MKLGNLNIEFSERLIVKDFLSITKMNTKFQKGDVDETELGLELMKIVIKSINNETGKDKIHNFILEMDSLADYTALSEEVAKRIETLVNPSKKKS